MKTRLIITTVAVLLPIIALVLIETRGSRRLVPPVEYSSIKTMNSDIQGSRVFKLNEYEPEYLVLRHDGNMYRLSSGNGVFIRDHGVWQNMSMHAEGECRNTLDIAKDGASLKVRGSAQIWQLADSESSAWMLEYIAKTIKGEDAK